MGFQRQRQEQQRRGRMRMVGGNDAEPSQTAAATVGGYASVIEAETGIVHGQRARQRSRWHGQT